MRLLEFSSPEVAALAEAASGLVGVHPEAAPAVAELAALLTVRLSAEALPTFVTSLARFLSERRENAPATTIPSAERVLWEDGGADFSPGAVERDAVTAGAAFSDLVVRSVEGDGRVAARLGVDRSRVSQRLRERSLYAFAWSDARYFPEWQFTEGGTLPGLRDVLPALDERLHPLVVDHWFRAQSVDLLVGDVPLSPLEWLETGGNPHALAELASDL